MLSKYCSEYLIDFIRLEFGLEFGSWLSNISLQGYNFMIDFPVELVLLATSSGALISSTYELTMAVVMIISF